MTKPRALTFASLIAGVGFAALSATASQAQVPPRPGVQTPPAAARPAPPSRAEIEKRIADRRAERAKDLATVLRVTPAQKPAFDAYMASRSPGPRPAGADRGDRMRDAQARRDMTTAQRLDEQARRGAERQAAQAKRTEALRTFYNALSPEQKQVFDALGRLRGDGGRGHGRGFDGRKAGDHRAPGGPRGQFGPGGPAAPGGWGPPR